MGRLSKIIGVLIFFLSINYYSAMAKPMDTPTLEEAIKSNLIVIADYLDYDKDKAVSYFQGPVAHYKVTRILKGDKINSYIKVIYAFQDGSACLEEEDWKFTKNIMPLEGNEFILFLTEANEKGVYNTYRGDYGRWKLDESSLKEVESAIISKYGSLTTSKPLEVAKPRVKGNKFVYYIVILIIAVLIFLGRSLMNKKRSL